MIKEILQIPGMIDTHVHLRDPGATNKEDFFTGTMAALTGGVTTVLDMPNNPKPIVDQEALREKISIAERKAVCDYGFYLGANQNNFGEHRKIANEVWGLKIYLDSTHGPLLVNDLLTLKRHFEFWPGEKPICVHAEGSSVDKVLVLIAIYGKRVHFCHISQASEIASIKAAKKRKLPVTCEVTPHHLFLTEEDERALGSFGRMKPPLRRKKDQEALWQAIKQGVVDTIASDHAPHTKKKKLGDEPPFGVPGLETTLPLLLTAVAQGKLSLERLVELTSTNPAKIFGLKLDKDNWIEVDIKKSYLIENSNLKTKCGWSPFDGERVTGKVRRVFLRGKMVFEDGEILVQAGFGQRIF